MTLQKTDDDYMSCMAICSLTISDALLRDAAGKTQVLHIPV